MKRFIGIAVALLLVGCSCGKRNAEQSTLASEKSAQPEQTVQLAQAVRPGLSTENAKEVVYSIEHLPLNLEVPYNLKNEKQSSFEFYLSPEVKGKKIEWWTTTRSQPAGLEMKMLENGNVQLVGYGKFQHEWCFDLVAGFDGEEKWISVTKEICFVGKVGSDMKPHWMPNEARELDSYAPIKVGKTYFGRFDEGMKVTIDSAWVEDGKLPPGLTVKVHPEYKKVYIEGKPTAEGVYTFAIKSVRNDGVEAVRQFVMKVTK